ncbi:MAG: hypothetical protein QOH96_1254 [Blastocatellia bacterium]|nr:hypothetical protein [Blastocatellia bacterium]
MLLFSIAQLCSGAAPVPVMGKLRTRGNKPVSVNGHKVATGSTVISGARIESQEAVGATIEIANVGRVDIAPNSVLTVAFDGARIDVRLEKGYVILTTKIGVDGTVVTSEGTISKTDPSRESSVAGRTANGMNPNVAATAGAGRSRVKPSTIVGGIGAVASGTGAIVGATRGRGKAVSPSKP